MSNPQPALAPVPRQRSFAGPVVLIGIGVVFLLGNLHVITWPKLASWFAHWWPLLLIFYGLLKLVEYYSAKREGSQFRGLGAGGVLLVIFIIILGLTASGVQRVNWPVLGSQSGWNGDFAGLFGSEYNYTDVVEQDYPADASLKVVSTSGDVSVTAWDQNRIKVEVTKRVRAESQGDADKQNQNSQPVITVAGNEVTLNANNENRPVAADLQIFIPRKGDVSIETAHGDVVLRDRVGNVKLSNSHGDVTIENVTGNADVVLRHGDFHATRVSNDVNLDGRLDDVAVAEVGGNLRMTGEYFGDLNISKIAKSVMFKTSRTDLQFAKLDGDMTVQSDSLHAATLNGPVRITTRAKDIHLENVSGEVNLTNSNATVEVSPANKLPLGQISINNKNGSVDLMLPAKSSFQLEAQVQKGQLQSDFGLNINTQHGDSSASGQIGNGGPKIQINSLHGDVAIRKAG